jgi:NAD(P)-dependent dehydrogenase (short-subunit alcohol dehydrogenase family)
MKQIDKNSSRTAFVLGASADIGVALSLRLLRDGWRVVGTGRPGMPPDDLKKESQFSYLVCDLTKPGAVAKMVKSFAKLEMKWDLFISAVGTLEPIGSFFELDFDTWDQSVRVNSTEQLRVLHALWPYRSKDDLVDVMLMAGGGTNNPFTNYSAYCVAKIALIKMTELLDDEEKNLNIFIIGPGFVRTRIHEETLRAGSAAGSGYAKTVERLKMGGTPMDDIYAHLQWCMKQGRSISGGRNFSTQYDPWKNDGTELANQLRDNTDGFRLRRMQPLPAKDRRKP